MTMLRYNAGKIPASLIPTSFFEAIFNSAYECGAPLPTKLLELVGQVLDFGAQKYDAHNWRKGGPWSSVMNSALRHLVFRMIPGFTTDAESGLSEAGHLGCNIAFLLEFAHTGNGTDDRFRTTWTPGFTGNPDPSLVWVLNELLAFRDGGSTDRLVSAAWELARWVEAQQEPTKPAEPPKIHTGGVVRVNTDTPLPFRFPSFNIDVSHVLNTVH
ncbi:dATP/dGTP diphosphohydrolase domain-containing protein [Rhizobium ruizarguesonis]